MPFQDDRPPGNFECLSGPPGVFPGVQPRPPAMPPPPHLQVKPVQPVPPKVVPPKPSVPAKPSAPPKPRESLREANQNGNPVPTAAKSTWNTGFGWKHVPKVRAVKPIAAFEKREMRDKNSTVHQSSRNSSATKRSLNDCSQSEAPSRPCSSKKDLTVEVKADVDDEVPSSSKKDVSLAVKAELDNEEETLACLEHLDDEALIDVEDDAEQMTPAKRIKLETKVEPDPATLKSKHTTSTSDSAPKEYAFVALVYGKDPGYCIEAAVLAHSLKRTQTKHKLVLMHTKDVSHRWRRILTEVGWELRQVEYIFPGNPRLPPNRRGKSWYKGGRFSGVFTKLWCISYTEFDKVLFLDTDLLVRPGKSIDHLFERAHPAALRRQARGDCPDGEKMNGFKLFAEDQSLVGGINAGVMLLKPNAIAFKNMRQRLKIEDVPLRTPSSQPEQDFLTMYYMMDWKSLGVEYNYQLHQLAYCVRPGNEQSHRLKMSYDAVHILHFSAVPKPRDQLLSGRTETQAEFTECIIKNYTGLLRNEQRTHKCSERILRNVKLALENQTRSACTEWYAAWESLLEEHPHIADHLPERDEEDRRRGEQERRGRGEDRGGRRREEGNRDEKSYRDASQSRDRRFRNRSRSRERRSEETLQTRDGRLEDVSRSGESSHPSSYPSHGQPSTPPSLLRAHHEEEKEKKKEQEKEKEKEDDSPSTDRPAPRVIPPRQDIPQVSPRRLSLPAQETRWLSRSTYSSEAPA
eukprot:gnl/MRDRNA2_/MRDRNA2_108706_c0_seq1.p1 gnl/MRDRNA2_/MRDRNA2_108706_c0~~gnl/MRDRNA2_/MRDRNA2_108706_c0_seq1.p1  ORF type:complete len:841 (-),score=167.76 gnl/MRDRNA2_/MRDRNA2_108706_c0_seq1:64-2298(-)